MLVDPVRRQNFAGKLSIRFYNIWLCHIYCGVCHFRVLTQRVNFDNSDPWGIWWFDAKIVMSCQFRNLAMFPLRVCLWLSVSIGQCRLPSHCWGKGSFPVKVNLETFLSCPRSEDEKNLNTDNNRRMHLSFWILQALHKPCKRKKSWRISVFSSAVQDRQGRLMSCCLPFVEWKEVDQSGLSSTNLS